MTTPKSANERIRRKIRGKKIGKHKSPDMTGRVVVKKSANNDPNRNHSDATNKRRHMAAEDFLRFYRGEKIESPSRFRDLIESFIKICVDAAGDENIPFKISRLCELRESAEKDMDENAVPYVVIKQVMEPREVHVCPICNEEIGEKSTYLPEDQRDPSIVSPEWQHNQCGGRFRYQPSGFSIEDLMSNPITVPNNK